MNNDMEHMNFIESIAFADTRVLQSKEATYQGSWKRAGGRSAWFMMRRNMDRLLSMMAPPPRPSTFNITNVIDTIHAIDDSEPQPRAGHWTVNFPGTREATVELLTFLQKSHTAEDIFGTIEAEPSGNDGTVLACLRDLRRYLLLIEAEMVSRGVVTIEGAPAPKVDERGPEVRNVIVSFDSDDEVSGTQDLMQPGTPEDGGHHEKNTATGIYEYPWIIDQHEYCTLRARVGSAITNAFYSQRAPGIHRLEAVVTSNKIPGELSHHYTYIPGVPTRWLIKLDKMPRHVRDDDYPWLQREMNAKEFEQSLDEFKFMYGFYESELKYKLHAEFDAWGRFG